MTEPEVFIEHVIDGYFVVMGGEDVFFTRNLAEAQDAANELRETGEIGDNDEHTA